MTIGTDESKICFVVVLWITINVIKFKWNC